MNYFIIKILTRKLFLALYIFLSSVATAGTIAVFEGKWEQCFKVDGDTPAAGNTVCPSYTILQHNKKICGSWTGFATQETSGNLVGVVNDKNKIKINQICGSGEYAQTQCSDDRNKQTEWESSTMTLTLCRGKLIDAKVCNLKTSGMKRIAFKTKMKKDLLRLQPWLLGCLEK